MKGPHVDTKSLSKSIDRAGSAAEDAAATVQARAEDVIDAVVARAQELSDHARDAADDTFGDDDDSNTLLTLLVVLGVVGLVLYLLKRRREQELDEALWEEPRAL